MANFSLFFVPYQLVDKFSALFFCLNINYEWKVFCLFWTRWLSWRVFSVWNIINVSLFMSVFFGKKIVFCEEVSRVLNLWKFVLRIGTLIFTQIWFLKSSDYKKEFFFNSKKMVTRSGVLSRAFSRIYWRNLSDYSNLTTFHS